MPHVPPPLDMDAALLFEMDDLNEDCVTPGLTAPMTFEVLGRDKEHIGYTNVRIHTEGDGLWMLRTHIDVNATGMSAADPCTGRMYRLVAHEPGYIPFPYRALSKSPGPCASCAGILPEAVAHNTWENSWELCYTSGYSGAVSKDEAPVAKRSRRIEPLREDLCSARPPAFVPPDSVFAHHEMKIRARSPPWQVRERVFAADVAHKHTLLKRALA